MKRERIVIIGGGITGLSTAYYLNKAIEEGKVEADWKLYEASSRFGGKIETVHRAGCTIEKGPDSFLIRKKSMSELGIELGMGNDLVTNASGAFVYYHNQLQPIPDGAVMGIPTQWKPFLRSNLFTWRGKLRAMADLILPRSSKSKNDQSLGSFFRHRLGDEVVDNLIDPLLSGIYAGKIDSISLEATFPQFQRIEEANRSLIKGMKKQQKQQKQKSSELNKKNHGMFYTFKNGLSSFIDALVKVLPEDKLNKDKPLTNIEKIGESYRLMFSDGSYEEADRIIFSVPHEAIARIFPEDSQLIKWADTPSTSVATVAMVFPEDAIKSEINGTGFLVPKNTGYSITACTWTHKKWDHTAPKGKAILRAYVGKPGEEGIVEESDEVITKTVLDDFKKIMEIEGEPLFTEITRWRKAMPQYEVNHLAKVKETRQWLDSNYPKISINGASFEGIGLPDCVTQGKNEIDRLVKASHSL